MNKIRRKQLQEASELIAKAQGIIESVKDEEQEAHDNLPESIQYGEASGTGGNERTERSIETVSGIRKETDRVDSRTPERIA